VLDGRTVVARHQRAVGKGCDVLDLDHYLEVFRLKPGALPGATALHQARASGAFSATHDAFYKEARRRLGDAAGTRAMVEVLLAHRTMGTAALVSGMERALQAGSVDPAVVLVEARRAEAPSEHVVVPLEEGLARFDRPAPGLSPYDVLLEATR
jgi:hypothetical protein